MASPDNVVACPQGGALNHCSTGAPIKDFLNEIYMSPKGIGHISSIVCFTIHMH